MWAVSNEVFRCDSPAFLSGLALNLHSQREQVDGSQGCAHCRLPERGVERGNLSVLTFENSVFLWWWGSLSVSEGEARAAFITKTGKQTLSYYRKCFVDTWPPDPFWLCPWGANKPSAFTQTGVVSVYCCWNMHVLVVPRQHDTLWPCLEAQRSAGCAVVTFLSAALRTCSWEINKHFSPADYAA